MQAGGMGRPILLVALVVVFVIGVALLIIRPHPRSGTDLNEQSAPAAKSRAQ